MKKNLLVLLAVFFALGIMSCNNDDDDSSEDVEERDDQEAIDDPIVKEFLDNYTYNDLAFVTDETLTDQDIVFYNISEGSIAGVTSGISLSDSSTHDITAYEHTYEDEDEEEITQTYYVISVRGGEGKEIREADRVNLTYQTKIILTEEDNSGAYLLETNKINIDSITTRAWFNSTLFVDSFNQGLTKFKTGTPIDDNDCSIFGIAMNGELTMNNDFGIGIVVSPSGLAFFDDELYFNNEQDDDDDGDEDNVEDEDAIDYRNLVFTFSTFNTVDQDLDSDGIFSADEDLNGDGDFDNDDTDGDEIPNYLDSDDDDDGVFTILEVELNDTDDDEDSDCDGILTNDNDVQFIYSNSTFDTGDDDTSGAQLQNPGIDVVDPDDEDVILIPFHLDDTIEYDEDDYEIEE